jgi:hypothetical protein
MDESKAFNKAASGLLEAGLAVAEGDEAAPVAAGLG